MSGNGRDVFVSLHKECGDVNMVARSVPEDEDIAIAIGNHILRGDSVEIWTDDMVMSNDWKWCTCGREQQPIMEGFE